MAKEKETTQEEVKEEQEVVTNLLPDRGENHEEHRLTAILCVVPVIAHFAEKMGNQPASRVE